MEARVQASRQKLRVPEVKIGERVVFRRQASWFNISTLKKLDGSKVIAKTYWTERDLLKVHSRDDSKEEMYLITTRARGFRTYEDLNICVIDYKIFEDSFERPHPFSVEYTEPIDRSVAHIRPGAMLKIDDYYPNGVTLVNDNPVLPKVYPITGPVLVHSVNEPDFFTIKFWTKDKKAEYIQIHFFNAYLFATVKQKSLVGNNQKETDQKVEDQLKSLKSLLEETEERIKNLWQQERKELEDAHTSAMAQEKSMKDAQIAAFTPLVAQNKQLEEKIESLNAENSQKDVQIASLNTEKSEQDSQIDSLKAEIASLKAESSRKDGEIDSLKAANLLGLLASTVVDGSGERSRKISKH